MLKVYFIEKVKFEFIQHLPDMFQKISERGRRRIHFLTIGRDLLQLLWTHFAF